jgi:hypothetical protein
MPVLTPQQRSTLEKAIVQARKQSESGARNALNSLAVNQPEPFLHLSAEQQTLRIQLRSKGQLLGDDLTTGGNQEIGHLAYELAYEYWHKMLFAKFLGANSLLIHPDGVPVTLDDCEELASDEGFTNKWTAAAFYASKMLPAIFRPEDPLMQVEFAPNDRINLESLLEKIEDHIYLADDALGWVYQFWQSEAKAAINASGDKIDGAKLPAVTQLFTEPYMVNFLIDNTIGAWWVSRHPGVTPPVKFEYLRLLDDGTPAAGKFEGWPNTTAEITMLDPCMGSGHFVVSVFTAFTKLRMFEEDFSIEEAIDRVIIDNLHGLEIDPRCTQIAAFNLALTAWKFCGDYKELPEMNLACSGIAPKGKVEDWVKLIGKEERFEDKTRMENGMRMLYDHFQLAPELGSLLDPSSIKADINTASFGQLQPVLVKALKGESNKDLVERGVMAAGIAKGGEILTNKYTLVITNVPYLGRGKQVENGIIANYCLQNYPEAKGDLANVFLEKMLKSNTLGGISCTVIPQNWLFLTSYKKYREKLLNNETWHFIAKLGSGAFSQISGEVVKAILVAISHQKPSLNLCFSGFDVSEASNTFAKDCTLKTNEIKELNQFDQLNNPDSIISMEILQKDSLLGKFAKSLAGIDTGDSNRFKLKCWELATISEDWIVQLNSFDETKEFSGRENILFWQEGKGDLLNVPGASIRNVKFWKKKGVYVVRMAATPATISFGEAWDRNGAMIIPDREEDLLPIWEFAKTTSFRDNLRKLNSKLSISEATFPRIHFDLPHWQSMAKLSYPNGLPKPYSDDAAQWLFHGHPIKAENPLQIALARLLGHRWPAESDQEMELSDEARQLIREIEPFNSLSDNDGIMCIPSVNGELAASERLRSYLQTVWGAQYNTQTISSLLNQEGSRKTNLEDWLREEFFEQHIKLFQNRPFIWHIWDGRKDGFAALVNYHKLNKETLQRLIYTYLGDWIRQCESKQQSGESGAEGLLVAANKLREKLLLIQEGESPFDIFVRWKKLEEQPIGWDPDLNDGVRLNIRPFIQADVLKKRPNIKWGIDRGKNPTGSPWGEIRDNDRHLTLVEKRAARANKK